MKTRGMAEQPQNTDKPNMCITERRANCSKSHTTGGEGGGGQGGSGKIIWHLYKLFIKLLTAQMFLTGQRLNMGSARQRNKGLKDSTEMCAEYQFNLLALNSHANFDLCQGISMTIYIVCPQRNNGEGENSAKTLYKRNRENDHFCVAMQQF